MSAGGSSGSSDSRFERTGTVDTTSWRGLTDRHESLFGSGLGAVQDTNLGPQVGSSLSNRLGRSWGDVPYNSAVDPVLANSSPSNRVPGQSSLTSQAAVNPYSSEYDDNTFAKYSDAVLRSIGQARSGPAATRGGTAAQGFAMGDIVSQLGLNRQQNLTEQRSADARIQQGASQAMSAERAQMNDALLKGVSTGQGGFFELMKDQGSAGQLATERAKDFNELVTTYTTLSSKMFGNEANALKGRGGQTSSSVGAGINFCCFIFLEAYNGELPESVRRYRDMAAPESSARRVGYISMSKWLVPLMRVSGFSRSVVNHLLVKPLTRYGEWYYGKNKTGWVFWPVKQVWFKVWETIGKLTNRK